MLSILVSATLVSAALILPVRRIMPGAGDMLKLIAGEALFPGSRGGIVSIVRV